ncbi:MAG: hypothetical protein WCS80_00540 [Bacilli bacterium]
MTRRYIYGKTEKPKHYVHVDKAETIQDERQIQFNNWCKRKGVFNGSYLPVNPDTLEKKGWRKIERPKKKAEDYEQYERKSSGQIVRYDMENNDQYGHYH